MRRYFSQSRGSRFSMLRQPSEKTDDTDALNDESTNGQVDPPQPDTPLPPPNLKVKRVDHYWSSWSKSWKYRNTGSGVVAEVAHPVGNGSDNDPWQSFCFVVVRKMPEEHQKLMNPDPTFQVVVKSPYLLKACKDVMGDINGLSWTTEPLELDPQLLLSFFPDFESYELALRDKGARRTTEEEHVLPTVGVLLEYLRKDYRATLARIHSLVTHGEITFDLLYSILVPRTIVVTDCPTTDEPRALQLLTATKVGAGMCSAYVLVCESVDSTEEGALSGREAENARTNSNWRGVKRSPSADPSGMPSEGGTRAFGRIQNQVVIPFFKGTVKINSLEVFPLQYHHSPDELKKTLIERGRMWVSMRGVHHMYHEGTAARNVETFGGKRKAIKFNVTSRVMIDRGNFIRMNPNYSLPTAAVPQTEEEVNLQNHLMVDPNAPRLELRAHRELEEDVPLTDDELMLASPVLYGFGFADKIWLEFNVANIQPISWNDEAFDGLVLTADRKNLLRSLVDAHHANLGFDDFVRGKGQGLIINLFGPPGVGKTLSAEATSERVRRPLYVVGGGDLGTTAAGLDAELEKVFDIATSWKAIVLIDEADVFLERRSMHDLERNAMVAVFLRHVEYYRGILFLTTNRITAFDEAFLSRIHVALHFSELSVDIRAQIWRTFLRKAGVAEATVGEKLVQRLAERNVNGRQIKNACRTAQSLALSREEGLGYAHLAETLDAMEEFTADFEALGKAERGQ
ncbi:P-loop containing nucleoside triphosphate hydrolase protein [Epithele typhae]|uniref:P-loop containing nucleoside triphosphate hydrolase protein n=1 Tax=Epithele typhae TaxID=378194 RepID=UPI0020072AFF|nr:P-loop containing nucleoside triphosphate hydrolase protein [Epithele typhae]KAH9925055.1 P-loop containing nucleoside triphosphate hydrolase protein [Epithele typhae]